jgi:hypothetical protein
MLPKSPWGKYLVTFSKRYFEPRNEHMSIFNPSIISHSYAATVVRFVYQALVTMDYGHEDEQILASYWGNLSFHHEMLLPSSTEYLMFFL